MDACTCAHHVEIHKVPVAQRAVQHSGARAKAETLSKNAARTPPACASRTQIAVPVSARVPICVCVASDGCGASQRVSCIMPCRPHQQTWHSHPRSPRRHARHEKVELQYKSPAHLPPVPAHRHSTLIHTPQYCPHSQPLWSVLLPCPRPAERRNERMRGRSEA